MNKFYVYIYLDPRRPGNYNFPGFSFNFKPIYVGKGCSNRDTIHLTFCKKYDSHFYRILRRILNENKKSQIIRIKENLTEEEAFKLEIELIKIIGRTDLKTGTLLNKTKGGDGVTITKEKRSQNSINNWKRKEYRKFFLDLNSDNWKIIFPNKSYLIIKNLNEWCQKNNFNYSSCKTYSKRKTKYRNVCFINLNKQGDLTLKDFKEASTHKNKKRKISIYEIQFKNQKEFQITGLSTLYKLFNFSITHLQNSIINNSYAYDSFKIKKVSESIQYIQELTDFQKSLFLSISQDKLKNLRKKGVKMFHIEITHNGKEYYSGDFDNDKLQCKEKRDITALYDPETQKVIELVPSAKIRTTIIADSISIPKPNELSIGCSGKTIPQYYSMNNP